MWSWQEEQCRNMALTGKFPVPEFQRAGGAVICPMCSRPYSDHPRNIPHHWLTMLCNGRFVKL